MSSDDDVAVAESDDLASETSGIAGSTGINYFDSILSVCSGGESGTNTKSEYKK